MTKTTDLARRVAALFSSPKFRPLPERDLAKNLRLDPGQRGLLRQALRDLLHVPFDLDHAGSQIIFSNPTPLEPAP